MVFGWIILIVIVILILLIKFDFIRIFLYVQRIIGIYGVSKKFERRNKNAKMKILILGDSTGFGFGLRDEKNSIAGRLARDFLRADVVNESILGLKISGLERKFRPRGKEKFDLIVVMIGGNDIMRFADLEESGRNLELIFERAKKISRRVVLLPPGNVGIAPIFSFVLSRIYTRRTRRMRSIFMKVAKEKGVLFVDLFKERKEDISLKDIKKYYVSDYVHPSDFAYEIWYKELKKILRKDGFEFG